MFCENCGANINDGAKFCKFCGAPVSGSTDGRVNGGYNNRFNYGNSDDYTDDQLLAMIELEKANRPKSEFTGGAIENFFIKFLTNLVSVLTLFFARPAMMCWYYRWEAENTVYNGRKLVFEGKAGSLFGKYMLWVLLSVVTLGIYYIAFMSVAVESWKVKNTRLVGGTGESKFTGTAGGLFGVNMLTGFVSFITLGFGSYWAHCHKERWFCEHKVYSGEYLEFDGRAIQYFGKRMLWQFLTVITGGIFGFWLAVLSKKWTVSHTTIDIFGREPTEEEIKEQEEKRRRGAKKRAIAAIVLGSLSLIIVLANFISLSSSLGKYNDGDVMKILSDPYNYTNQELTRIAYYEELEYRYGEEEYREYVKDVHTYSEYIRDNALSWQPYLSYCEEKFGDEYAEFVKTHESVTLSQFADEIKGYSFDLYMREHNKQTYEMYVDYQVKYFGPSYQEYLDRMTEVYDFDDFERDIKSNKAHVKVGQKLFDYTGHLVFRHGNDGDVIIPIVFLALILPLAFSATSLYYAKKRDQSGIFILSLIGLCISGLAFILNIVWTVLELTVPMVWNVPTLLYGIH